MITLDVETARTVPGCMAPPLACVALKDALVESLVHWTDARGVVRAVLASSSPIVGHGIAFDFVAIAANFPELVPDIFAVYEADRVEDTGIRQKLLDIACGLYRGFYRRDGAAIKIGYGLDDLVDRHFAVKLSKGEDTWRLRYGELRDVPLDAWPEAARSYPLDDVRWTAAVHAAQEADRALLGDQHRQARADLWLRLASTWGLVTDPAAVRAYADKTSKEQAALARELVAAGLLRPDRVLKSGPRKGTIVPGSRDTKAAAARLVAAYTAKGEPFPTTEHGAPCLDEDACIKSGDPVLRSYGKFASTKKILSTDIPLLESGTHAPIHAHFDSLLNTGRTSSSPNVQNRPTKEGDRECFVPRPGHVYLAVDFAAFELRTWAQVCLKVVGFSRLAQVLNEGIDPHCIIAAAILGVPYDEAKRQADAGKRAYPDAYLARQCGKVCNFGCPGGLGTDAFMHFAALQYGVELTRDKSASLRALWRSQWPEAKPYLDWVNAQVDRPFPYVDQLFSGRRRGGLRYTEAANTTFQGLAADAAKGAGWLVSRACYVDRASVLYGSRIVNFVHDELITEVPEPIAHECAEEQSRLMVAGASPWLPDVPPKVEATLMRRWSKAAKPTFKNGRLSPWESSNS